MLFKLPNMICNDLHEEQTRAYQIRKRIRHNHCFSICFENEISYFLFTLDFLKLQNQQDLLFPFTLGSTISFISFSLQVIFSNKKALFHCNSIENFRSDFEIIMRAFLFDSLKNFQNLSRFHHVVFFLDLQLTIFHFYFECSINNKFVIPLVLIFIDKGSRFLSYGCLDIIKIILGK